MWEVAKLRPDGRQSGNYFLSVPNSTPNEFEKVVDEYAVIQAQPLFDRVHFTWTTSQCGVKGWYLAMNPWIAKGLVLAGTVVLMAIRAPHGHRSRSVKVATSYKTPLETGILVLAWVGSFLPLIWIASPAFSFAEYPLGTGTLVAGVICLVIGLWPLLPVAR